MNQERGPGQFKNSKPEDELQLEIPFDDYPVIENIKNPEELEEKDSNGRTRVEAAKQFKVANPAKLFLNKDINEWMMGDITAEKWDDQMKRLDEPADDDYLYMKR